MMLEIQLMKERKEKGKTVRDKNTKLLREVPIQIK